MSEYGGAVPHPALPGASVTNLNKPGTVGNGALSVPMFPQGGFDDNALLIWADSTTENQQIMRLTFPAPVNLKEVGIIADFGLGNFSDRQGKNARFRINGNDPNDPWLTTALLVGDVQDWFDYACARGDFQNVITVDFWLSDVAANDAYSPRIGAVLALTEETPTPDFFADITYVTGNIAPTATISNFGNGVSRAAIIVGDPNNLILPGPTNNGEISVPVFNQLGAMDTNVMIWHDGANSPDNLQVLRLTFPAPVNLKELGMFFTLPFYGGGIDRFGMNFEVRINAADPNSSNWGNWIPFDPETIAADVQDWWDYAAVRGDFQNVTIVDYRIGDINPNTGGPRIGAVVALTENTPLPDTNIGPWYLNDDMACIVPQKGTWSYGWSTGITDFTLMDTYVYDTYSQWRGSAAGGEPIIPHIWRNHYDFNSVNTPPGWHGFHPPSANSTAGWTKFRWTAPTSMFGKTATVRGEFVGIGTGETVSLKVVKVPAAPTGPDDYVTLFAIDDTDADQSFQEFPTINAGDSVDVMINCGSDGSTTNDWTGVQVEILEGSVLRTCQEQGIFMDADLNHDCYINLEDFAIIAKNWLYCNNPFDPTCD